ncbi:TetR/AcrR family transcriptional regulator [Streptomyces prunicolor]|uniref:TetR/AcrR family transcriptional regulator n=1 Tax=Streptomyces prunicolor TaxID=67348 RepID=UPI00386A7241|nr:TetR/AcrR family transcriptional regulator [Streptomyces prunicolor]
MSPRNSVAETRRTRQRIVDRSLAIASVYGLDGLTIGWLATDLGMSKAGVLGHFGTKERLQLAVVDAAAELFTREVPNQVAADVPPGLPRLHGWCDAWVSYLARDVLPGGCFLTAAAAEFDGRSGPVRDAIAGMNDLWQRDLRLQIRHAITAGELQSDTDADQLLYEVVGIMLALNHFLQLQRDRSAPDRARRALHRLWDGVKIPVQ